MLLIYTENLKNIIKIIFCIFNIFNFVYAGQALDPYKTVPLVTNTISWPYDNKTYGNDSFIFGSQESKNEDALILQYSRTKDGLTFPKDFNWGVAGSAYQYEGYRIAPNKNNPGFGWSIWDVFSQSGSWMNPNGSNIAQTPPTSDYTQANGADAIKGYQPDYYKQDIDLAKKLGVKYYRLSISWPRLFPKPNMKKPDSEGIKYYQEILEELKNNGFEILITLYHWDMPAWLHNFGDTNIIYNKKTYGWLDYHSAHSNLAIKEFQKYADTCFKYFGKYSYHFSTFNEPLSFTVAPFYLGIHAPGATGWSHLQELNPDFYGSNDFETRARLNYIASSNVIKAHFVAYKTFEKYRKDIFNIHNKKPMLGIVLNADWPEPYRIHKNAQGELAYNSDDVEASKNYLSFAFGQWLEPVMFGKWPDIMSKKVNNRLPDFQADDSCLTKSGQIQICNQYSTNIRLSNYIQSGGALDNISLNHYSGFFVVDSNFAKSNLGKKIQENTIAPNQSGFTPDNIPPGIYQDVGAYTTEFRYQLLGTEGKFADQNKNRAFVIGDAAENGLRQTWFGYRKLLHYINYYYLQNNGQTKQGENFKDLSFYLMENGTSAFKESQKDQSKQLDDRERIRYLQGNLAAVNQAIHDGIDVKLYTYWSMLDNFEWDKGYNTRFGLVWIDYSDNFKRIPKKSYYFLQKVIN